MMGVHRMIDRTASIAAARGSIAASRGRRRAGGVTI
jgi:hypothetical protein